MSYILIQLFWFSFIGIGLACESFLLRCLGTDCRRSIFNKLPLPFRTLIYFMMGIAVFIPFIAAAYVFHLSLNLLVALYVVACGASIWQLGRHIRIARVQYPRLTWQMVIGCIIVAPLIADYVYASRYGGQLHNTDVYVQMAKIHHIFDLGQFNLRDPYFGYNGVFDVRYSANLLNGLQAMAARLFHIDPLNVCAYSFAFHRLVIWLSIFMAAYSFVPRQYRKVLMCLIVFTTPLMMGRFFINAELPDRIGIAWFATTLVGLKMLVEGKGPILFYLSAALIAMTHALSALIVCVYIVLFGLLLVLLRLGDRKMLGRMVLPLPVLLIPVIANALLPSRIADVPAYFDAVPISGHKMTYGQHGGLFVTNVVWHVTLLQFFTFLGCGAVIWYISRSHSHRAIRSAGFLALVLLLLLVINTSLLGCVGLLAIALYIKDKPVKLMVVLLIVFNSLIVYNPLFITIVHDRVPPWLLGRFNELNILALISPVIGLYFLFVMPWLQWGSKKASVGATLATIFVVLAYIPHFTYEYSLYQPIYATSATRTNQKFRHNLQDLQAALDSVDDAVVYTSSQDLPSAVPAVSNNSVIGLNGVNASPSADLMTRGRCAEKLYRDLSSNDFAASGVSIIITSSEDKPDFVARLASSSQFKSIAEKGEYRVFQLKQTTRQHTDSPCIIPYGS